MQTLITFLNVASAMWVAYFFITLAWTYIEAKRLSKYPGQYNIVVKPFPFILAFAATAWLITGYIQKIEPQTETVEIEISNTQEQLESPAVLITEEEFGEE